MKKGDIRRQAILDAAEQLFYTNGYEATSVQDILDALDLSKGGFYHHFDSKLSLLTAISDQRAEASFQAAQEAVRACKGNAVEKLNALFDNYGIFQQNSFDFIGLLIRVSYREDSALMREKLKQKTIQRSLPLLQEIVHAGIKQGVFFTPYPDGIAELVLLLGANLTDEISMMIVKPGDDGVDELPHILEKLEVYRDAVQRLLDAPYGSIVLFKMERMTEVLKAMLEQNRRLAWADWERSREEVKH